jgi:hypothetical protein
MRAHDHPIASNLGEGSKIMDRTAYADHAALAASRPVPPQHLVAEPREAFSMLNLLAVFAAVVAWVVVAVELAS